MAEDIESAVAGNGQKVPTVKRTSKGDAKGPSAVSNGNGEGKAKSPAPSPVDEPGKAAAAKRSESAEIHKGLEANDAERMYAVEVLTGDVNETLRFLIDMGLKLQGKTIAADKLDAILNHETNAGFMVVKTDHGNAIRPRKLSRVEAIAYGLGGAAVSVYERAAAIQIVRPVLYATGLILVQVAAAAIDANAVAEDKVSPPEPTQEPASIVDARDIAEDGRE